MPGNPPARWRGRRRSIKFLVIDIHIKISVIGLFPSPHAIGDIA